MELRYLSAVVAALTSLIAAEVLQPETGALPLVESNKLRRDILRPELLKKGEELQAIAYSTPGRNRAVFTEGHTKTIKWIYDNIVALSDYYTVELHEFIFSTPYGNLTAGRIYADATALTFTALGSVTGEIVKVPYLGCDAADYAELNLTGKIALIERGTCTFRIKTTFAGEKGALATVIFNNVGILGGTLNEAGTYPITGMIGRSQGLALVEALKAGPITGHFELSTYTGPTYNVIAQTKGGDQSNVLLAGAHSDSVKAGPGINDNGSGSIALLEVAKQLTAYSVNNAIRFGWWSAEEVGLVGSDAYVRDLSAEERAKITLYLNFDMIASPNFKYAIYDGDGSSFNLTGPPGSATAEAFFEDYFTNHAQLPYSSTPFNSRSDYRAFAAAGIPVGGLFTGAEELKTEAEAKLYGGKAGVAYDVNYHLVGDTIKNVDVGAWIQNTKAIAHAVATYGRSFASLGLGKREEHVAKRSKWVQGLPRDDAHTSHISGGGCVHDVSAELFQIMDERKRGI